MKSLIDKIDDLSILRIHEERLDSNIAPELKTQFLSLIQPKSSKVIVDLDKVKYVDSSGLGALLFGYRQVRDHDGSFKLLKAKSRVLDLIHIAQLGDVLINYNDETEALASFKEDNI